MSPDDSAAIPALSGAALAARVTLALGIAATAGASVGLCIAYFLVVDERSFLTANATTPHVRDVMTLAVLGGGFLCGASFALPLLMRRLAALPTLVRSADVIAPLCLAGFLPILLAYRAWEGRPLTFLVLLSVVVLVAEQLLARSFAAFDGLAADSRPSAGTFRLPLALRRHAPLAIVLLAATAYAIDFSHYTLLNHRRFGTAGFDLGINVNWCWNAIHGHFFRTPVLFGPNGGSMIAGHAIFAVFLWLPVFAMKPGAEVLLVYQSVMAAVAAVPLYLFARTQIPRWSAACVSLAYLMYAPLHGPNFYDFHELVVALPWHFLLYWLLATNRTRWASLVVVILWAHREDVAVGLAMLGLVLLLSGARPRFGAGLAVASGVWFVIDKFVIMPYAGTWWFASIYKELMPGGEGGYGGIVQTILINPAYFLQTLLTQEKLIYFLHMFAPLAFLPLRRPLLVLLAIPGFFFTLMTTGYAPTVSIAFQYTTHFIPYLFGAAVLALRIVGRMSVAEQRAALCALMLGVTLHSVSFGAIFQHETFVGGFSHIQFVETPEDVKRYAGFQQLVAKIPESASVAATEAEVAHVSARANTFTLKSDHGDAEYLLVNKNGAMNRKVLQAAFDRNVYGLVGQSLDTFYLFKKGFKSPATAQALNALRLHAKVEGGHG